MGWVVTGGYLDLAQGTLLVLMGLPIAYWTSMMHHA